MSKASHVNVRIDSDIRRWLDAIAEKRRESVSVIVREIVLEYYNKNREGGGDKRETSRPPFAQKARAS